MNERMIIFCNKRRAQPRRTRIITLVSSKLFFCLPCMLLLLFHYRIINVLSFSSRSSSSSINNNNRRIGIKRRKRNSIIVRNNSITNGLNLRNDDEIDENDDITVRLQKIRDQQLREAVLERLFLSNDSNYNDDSSPSSSSLSSSFVSLSLVGQSKLPVVADATSSTSATTVLVLHDNDGKIMINTNIAPHPVLFVPVAPSPNSDVDRKMKLVEHVYKNEPILSLTILLQWNLNLINRDGGIFDNLPWTRWSKDPDQKNRDAAQNLIEDQFHYGKRDAYQRFLGKDMNMQTVEESKRQYWQQQLVSSMDDTNNDGHNGITIDESSFSSSSSSSFSVAVLSKRVLELRIQELRMELADIESQIAITRTETKVKQRQQQQHEEGGVEVLEQFRAELVQNLQEVEKKLNGLVSELKKNKPSSSSTTNIIETITRWVVTMSMGTRQEQKEAPYRGATGYTPRLNNNDDGADLNLIYRSPYDLLIEIIHDQLKCEIYACVLENTSYFDGTVTLEGAIVLRRTTPTQQTTVMGEVLEIPNYEEEYGNPGIKSGNLYVVDCTIDEIIGVALSCDVPIRMERSLYEHTSRVGIQQHQQTTSKAKTIPYWNPVQLDASGRVLEIEDGDDDDSFGGSSSTRLTSTASSSLFLPEISIPKTTSSLFGIDRSSSSMFPTDNPITSIEQYDELGNSGKVKTLLEMSNFKGTIPRPRLVRQASEEQQQQQQDSSYISDSGTEIENPLDALLIPLIDETVRKDYTIREAIKRNDMSLVEELISKKSNRQQVQERLELAQACGNTPLVEQLENELKVLDVVRADVTQDEGSYSRFLDKDDWYENDRQRTANRANRSSFGTLLDGIE